MRKVIERPRRNRRSEALRNMVAETILTPGNLVWPVFITEGTHTESEIRALPGCARWSVDVLLERMGQNPLLSTVALFPAIPDGKKTPDAKEALNRDGLVPAAVRRIKDRFPDRMVITDIALDPFNSDGHDGLVKNGKILNDETVDVLARMALIHAEAGADFVAPSDMMDGRVGAIRGALDECGHTFTGIISYSAKYASSFYGPFREALDSAPKAGDKKTYQMDFRNSQEALREVRLDVAEGADVVMVKPALAYLDVIRAVSEAVDIPVAAYNVSGEYAMIKAAAERGMIDETRCMVESLFAIRRAGAQMIFTYFAPQMARWLEENSR